MRTTPDSLLDLLKVSRPVSWVNTGLPFLAAGFAAGHRLTPALALGAVYFLAPYNLLLYGVNDLFDYESDRRNPRKGGTVEGGLITPELAGPLWIGIALTNAPLVTVVAALAGPEAAALLAVTAAAALVYSAPPLRTKERPGVIATLKACHLMLGK